MTCIVSAERELLPRTAFSHSTQAGLPGGRWTSSLVHHKGLECVGFRVPMSPYLFQYFQGRRCITSYSIVNEHMEVNIHSSRGVQIPRAYKTSASPHPKSASSSSYRHLQAHTLQECLSTIQLWKNQLQPHFTFHPSHFTLPFQSSLFKMKAFIILTLLAAIGTALPTSPQQDDKSLDRRVR